MRAGRLWHTLLLSKWRTPLAWLPVESAIKRRQADYYDALEISDAMGSSEVFVEFMLEATRDSMLPFAKPAAERDLMKSKVAEFFKTHPAGAISQLVEHFGCSRRSVERIVAELKDEGVLIRQGSACGNMDNGYSVFERYFVMILMAT